jgi:predicted membrane protein
MVRESVKSGSELLKINRLLTRRLSFKHIFMLGLVQGLGTALGATIIAGVVLALLLRFANFLDIPLINQYIESRTNNSPIERFP